MKVRFLAAARREPADAVRYYNAEKLGLGKDFRIQAQNAVERIKMLPDAWQSLGDDIRRCQFQRFPYAIVYSVRKTEILVIAVAHLHREPNYWRR